MRRSTTVLYKMPKNMGVAPRFDTWNEKYEPWQHMKNMGRLVGTGFYIPPEWYNHFRMFPPINHNFSQERTLNPSNESEPTQDDTVALSRERIALRDELARKSRLVASEGMRYYNIFWVQKPLDRMEREYYALKRRGVPHDVAIKKVLQGFYDDLAVKKRVANIQSEEAKLSGKFITMREATVVMNVLVQLQKEQRTPHQVAQMARSQRQLMQEGSSVVATMKHKAASPPAAAAAAAAAADTSAAAESLSDLLARDDSVAEADMAARSGVQYTSEVTESPADNTRKLRELAADHTGKLDWYSGISPFYDLE